MLICDAQVHAPSIPNPGQVSGIDYDDLVEQMKIAAVDRAVIVPLQADEAGPDRALAFTQRAPHKFLVMAPPPIDDVPKAVEALLEDWKERQGLAGIRVSFWLRPDLLTDDGMGWLWRAAERLDLPVMINAAGNVLKVGEIAARYPSLRIALDHMGLTPFHVYDDLLPAIEPVIALAGYANLSVKASALPASVNEPFPFPSLHEPIRRIVEAFGPRRVFWGSDLTRLPCTYTQCRKLFTDVLDFLSGEDREWISGRALCEWIRWP